MLPYPHAWRKGCQSDSLPSTATEQNIGKRMKENEDSLTDLCESMLVAKLCPTLCDHKDYCTLIAENFPNMGKEIVSQGQEAQSPRKPKEEHIEKRGNQTDKN